MSLWNNIVSMLCKKTIIQYSHHTMYVLPRSSIVEDNSWSQCQLYAGQVILITSTHKVSGEWTLKKQLRLMSHKMSDWIWFGCVLLAMDWNLIVFNGMLGINVAPSYLISLACCHFMNRDVMRVLIGLPSCLLRLFKGGSNMLVGVLAKAKPSNLAVNASCAVTSSWSLSKFLQLLQHSKSSKACLFAC